MASLEGLYAGRIERLELDGGAVTTAIRKRALGTVRVGELGIDGDEQADRKNHGGPDMALCVYPAEHYALWRERLGRELAVPAFGENLRVAGRLEDAAAIDEVWRVGEVLLQVVQPRVPCSMPAALNGERSLNAWMRESGATGYLLRVLQGGELTAPADIEVVERPRDAVTIGELNRLRYREPGDVAGLRRALASEGLTATWRERLEGQLRRAAG